MCFLVPGDPYRTFFALTRLADECPAEVADDRWDYESAVDDFIISNSSPSGRDGIDSRCAVGADQDELSGS